MPSWAPYGDADAGRKVVFAFDMDGFSAAPPMSYMHNGRQFITMSVGGNEDAAMVAYALPSGRGN